LEYKDRSKRNTRGVPVVKVKNQRAKASQALDIGLLLVLGLAWLGNDLTMVPPALAGQPNNQSAEAEAKPKVVKPGEGRRKFIPVKIDQRFASGTLMGHPFNLVKATCTGNTIVLDGGDIIASDPSKGRTKIVIEFSTPQVFANESYQVRYNATQAVKADSQTKAPAITYVAQDKSGAVVSTTATNGSKSDNLDYAMELRFSPLTKKGELPGFIRLQIGSDPVSDVKGYFYASR
jgi:hypothetical protein